MLGDLFTLWKKTTPPDVFTLSVSVDYVGHWGVVEAVRELFQNAIDYDHAGFEWEIFDCADELPMEGDERFELHIQSPGARLKRSTLLMGGGTKTGDLSKIGEYGEGYKLAMLVLCRLGHRVVIQNTDELWKPEIVQDDTYDAMVLQIAVHEFENAFEGIRFIVKDLEQDDIDNITESNLRMQPEHKRHSTINGAILTGEEHKGKIYVGGLKVTTDDKLHYGYDFAPKALPLGRDREAVSAFNLQWATAQCWTKANWPTEVVRLMEEEALDVQYVTSAIGATGTEMNEIDNVAAHQFLAKHPGAMVADSQTERDELKSLGHNAVYIEQAPLRQVIKRSPLYTVSTAVVSPRTPYDVLSDYSDIYLDDFTEAQSEAFEAIMELSREWS